jgi:hypothetical protein
VELTTHPLSSAEVIERVELYLYSAFGLSWPVTFSFYSPATGGYELSHAVTSCVGNKTKVAACGTL